MGRKPCCEKTGLKKGKWTAEEDEKLINYMKANGEGSWRSLPKNAGLLRCGKSCRLRWINYLRADVKRGNFTADEEETIVKLHKTLGNRWSLIASHLLGRTDNEIKNYWNSHLSRRIYSFRSVGEFNLTTADMIKMVSTGKKRVGRVSRAFAKKYNKMNASSHFTVSRTIVVDKQATAKEAGEKDLGPLDTCERNNAPSGTDLTSKDGWPSALLLSPKEGRETEMARPLEEVDDMLLMQLEHFLEVEMSDQSENSLINDESDKAVMNSWDDMLLRQLEHFLEVGMSDQSENNLINDESNKVVMNSESFSPNQGRDCALAGSIDSETWGKYSCPSPAISSFNDDEVHWDLHGAGEELNLWGEELNLWSEEEDMLIWP